MIVRNEEQNLAQCLEPVAGLFDEIIIVDTGSQDRTREVARRFTPHVFDFPWCDDFSAARNEALKHATGNWIFWLDADDRVRGDNVEKLKGLLAGLNGQSQVFMMETMSPSAGASEVEMLTTHPRLFRRHPDIRWEGRVHEQLRPWPSTIGHEVLSSDVQIYHVGYEDAALRDRKQRRKLRLLRMDYAVDPDNMSTLLHLAMAYAQIRTADEARKYLMRLVELSAGSAEYLRSVYHLLSELAMGEGKTEEALHYAQQGLVFSPNDEQLLFVVALIYYQAGQYDAAFATLQKMSQEKLSRPMHRVGAGNIERKLAPRMLGAVLRLQRLYRKAEEVLQGIVYEFPADTLSWYNLGLVYLDANDGDKLKNLIPSIALCPQGGVYANLLMALWGLRHGALAAAGALIDQLVAEAPQMPLPRMLRAEWLSRSGAPREAQIQALRDILRIQPGNAEAVHWLKLLEAVPQPRPVPANDPWSPIVLMPGTQAS
jgi:glycosyltransferase involved in cell wall biosynthesis